jgi:hypothetical protein
MVLELVARQNVLKVVQCTRALGKTYVLLLAHAEHKRVSCGCQTSNTIQTPFKQLSQVQLSHGNNTRYREIHSLQAKSFNNSVCGVQLSGIGPAETLQEFRIPVLADLPVGKDSHVCDYVQSFPHPLSFLWRVHRMHEPHSLVVGSARLCHRGSTTAANPSAAMHAHLECCHGVCHSMCELYCRHVALRVQRSPTQDSQCRLKPRLRSTIRLNHRLRLTLVWGAR